MILVVAGNSAQARRYIHETLGLGTKNIIIVRTPQQLRDAPMDSRVIYTGTYYARTDMEEIHMLAQLRGFTDGHHVVDINQHARIVYGQ